MKKSATIMVSTLLVMSFFGALFFGNTASDFESKIDKLEDEKSDLQDLVDQQNETIQSQEEMISNYISDYGNLNNQLNQSLSNITELTSELSDAQAYRDSLIAMLDDSNDTNSDLEDDLMMAEMYSTYVQGLLDQEIANSIEINEKINSTNSVILEMLDWPAQDHLDQKYLNGFLNELISINWTEIHMLPSSLRVVCYESTGLFIGKLEPYPWGGGYVGVPFTITGECADYLNNEYGMVLFSEGDDGFYTTEGGENIESFNLDNFTLSETELQNVVITLSSVSYVDFTNANLSGASITSEYIMSSNFNGADLSGAKIVGDLTGSDFTGATVNGATIASYGQDCANIVAEGWFCISGHSIGPDSGYAENWDFSFSNFSGMNLTGKEIINANFTNSDLTNIVVLDGIFSGDFTGADLTGATINQSIWSATGTNVTCPGGNFVEQIVDCFN